MLRKWFNKGYDASYSVGASPIEGTSSKASFKHLRNQAILSKYSISQFDQNFNFIAQIDTLGSLLGLLELTPYDRPFVKLQTQVIADLEDLSGYISSLSLEHLHSAYRAKVAISKGPILKTSGVTGNQTLGFGWDLGFDFMSNRFLSYNVATFMKSGASRLVLKHESNNRKEYTLGDIALSGYYPFNSSTKLAAEVRLASTGLIHTDFALQRDLSDSTAFKLKLKDRQVLSVGVMFQISNELRITGGVDLNLKESSELGMGLSFKWTL